MDDDKVYTISQLAERWQVSYQAVYERLRSRKLKGFRIGQVWRITAAEVARFENDQ